MLTIFTGKYRQILANIELGFNDTSTLVGYFVSSPEKRRREIEEIVEEMKERDRGERKMNESEETEEIKPSPSTFNCSWTAGLAQL